MVAEMRVVIAVYLPKAELGKASRSGQVFWTYF